MLPSETIISHEEAETEVRGIGDVALATALIAECSEEIETVLDRQVVSRGNITEYHRFTDDSSELWLRWFPVISVVSVHEDSDRAYTNTALVEGTDYIVDKQTGKLTRISGNSESSWLTGFEAVRVVWTGGYTQATVPGDLKRIAKEFFALKTRDIVGQRQGLSSVGDGLGTRTTYGPAELTSHMLGRLRRHRNYDPGGITRTRWSVAA